MSNRHISDYSKLPLDIVLDLINHDNGTSLSTSKITLGVPVVVENKRVSIEVTAITGSGYRGSQTLHYNRVPLSALTDLEETQTTVIADVTSYQEIIQKFNEKYGVNLTIDDVTVDGLELDDVTYIQAQGPVVDLLISAKEGNFVWQGTTTFKLRSSVMLLSDALPVVDLDGLWLPNRPSDPHEDIPEGKAVAVTDTGEVRVTDEGHVRVFEL